MIETHNQGGDPRTITLWMHKNYIESLGDEITITLGAGFNAFTGGLSLVEDVNYSMVVTVTVDDGTYLTTHKVIKGNTIAKPANPTKEMTATAIYTFDNWYYVDTDVVFDFSTVITEDVAIEARFKETPIRLEETEVSSIYYNVTGEDNGDRWLVFYLTNYDYPTETALYSVSYDELKRLGLLEHIIIQGTMSVGGTERTEATLAEIFAVNGIGDKIYLNIWNTTEYLGTIAFRTPGVTTITNVVLEEGACFPSYAYVSGNATEDIRYMTMFTKTFTNNADDGLTGVLLSTASSKYDIKMADGASVRLTSDLTTSGLRFETLIAVTSVEKLIEQGGV